MKVLSLFDGMSCGRIALDRAGLAVSEYFSSEIDKHAISVADDNYPNNVKLGDVTKIDGRKLPNIDLLIGGSPCQSISNLGDGSGLDGKSSLFFHYLRILEETKPKFFLLENVVGSKKAIDSISKYMKVEPVLFNSNTVSAQNRARYYWTNISFEKPTVESELKLADVLDEHPSINSKLSEARLRWLLSESGQSCLKKKYAVLDPIKANCLTTRSDASWNCNYVTRNGEITKLTPEEYEKLQTVPVGYTSKARTSERYRMLGNGWTVDVISCIFKGLI